MAHVGKYRIIEYISCLLPAAGLSLPNTERFVTGVHDIVRVSLDSHMYIFIIANQYPAAVAVRIRQLFIHTPAYFSYFFAPAYRVAPNLDVEFP